MGREALAGFLLDLNFRNVPQGRWHEEFTFLASVCRGGLFLQTVEAGRKG